MNQIIPYTLAETQIVILLALIVEKLGITAEQISKAQIEMALATAKARAQQEAENN